MKANIAIALTLIALLASACVPTPAATTPDTQVGTIVAETIVAMTEPAAPPTVSLPPTQPGSVFAFNNVSMSIPNGLATGATGETVARVEPVADGPYWDVAPEHTRITLQNYVTGERFHQPRIFVYPVEEFAQMNEGAAMNINELRTVLSGSAPLPPQLPHLPIFNAGQIFTAQAQLINLGSGRGVRYISQFAQAVMPINNNELLYTFQGITTDGQYYVAVQLPITAAMLDTMPTPDFASLNFTAEEYSAYIDNITKTLNSLGPVFFSPTLETLDAFVNSITINQ